MDVEKRMNLSLDAIIKEKSKPKGSGGSKRTPAVKGRGKVNIANLRLRTKNGSKAEDPRGTQKNRKSLGVQKKGMKVQRSGGKRIAIAIPVAKEGSTLNPRRGRHSIQKAAAPRRRAAPARNVAKPVGKSGGRPRTVEVPKLSELRITIANEKAASIRYPVTNVGTQAYQMQAGRYPHVPSQRSSAAYADTIPPHGFGPRNLQPREGGYARLAPDYPVPRSRQDYGVSRKMLGRESQPFARREPVQRDFDSSNPDKSYMRMDNVR